jgi:predicted  nucleic acid-binding Zn-ribbon protein
MPSVKEIEDTIALEQNKLDAIQDQIQQARDRDQIDLAESLQQQMTEHSDQISRLQSELPGAIEKEKQDAAEQAKKEQKKEDRGIGISDLLG